MKTLLAIIITIGLLIGTYVISALIYFDLTWVLVGVTSVWAGIDSKKIELSRYKLGISSSPIAVFCLCYLFWIVIFPYYLWAHFKIKEGTAPIKDEVYLDLSVRPVKRLLRQISKRSGKIAEWLLYCFVALKIGFLGFFIEECWRGPHVWKNYSRELEAKGESFDWAAMIPPPVLDSQNIFSAPMMSAWFANPSGKIIMTDDIGKRLQGYTNVSQETVIAEVTFEPPGTHLGPGKDGVSLRWEDPKSQDKVRELIRDEVGPFAFTPGGAIILVAHPLNISQVRPVQILLDADKRPNAKDVIGLFSGNSYAMGHLLFRPDGANSWRVLDSFCDASDYLKWSDQFDGSFDLMREAVKRPYARIEGDYSFPPTIPIPNYASIRAVSQTLAQRAQCYLLLGEPDKALREMTLINDLRQITEGAPTGKPMSMVSAMLNVAIAGVYAEAFADGLRLHAWKEPQLVLLQEQLAHVDLAPFLKESLHEEEVSAWCMMENMMRQFVVQRVPNATLLQKMKNLRPPNIIRGFFYFSIVNVVKADQLGYDSIDLSQKVISMQKVAEFQREEASLGHAHHWEIYKLLEMIAVPNFMKAIQTCALNQTKINEAQIVCALERYHLAHGGYPETLDELVPEYSKQLPHDIIGGQPLKYRRTSDDDFLLYSVGWNQTDDGGQFSSSYEQGDWVWQ